jgi:hypothetical protein
MTVKRDYSKTPKVHEFLKKHVGEIMHGTIIATELGLTPGDISGATSTLARQGVLEYGPTRGTYIYRGVHAEPEMTPKTDQLYSFVGSMQDGGIVVKDVDTEILYTLTKL